MRIARLHLDRYGPFTDKVLDFSPNAKLHVVFGHNESGKTSSLRAVTDLLFGIERSTSADFQHPAKDLRIGAVLRSTSGAELCFRRRKNKPVLTDFADKPIADDALAPYLGGLTRDVFRRAFGLDAESLRKSGDDLKASEGELGAALFSAASGLRGFNDLKARLESEADGIFAERKAQSRIFYQAQERYDAARKLLKDRETRTSDLRQLRDGIKQSEELLESVKSRRAAITAEQSRLQRLKRVNPILRAIDGIEADIRNLGDVPDACEGLGSGLVAALEACGSTTRRLEEARRHEAQLRETHDAIAVDERLLAAAGAIEALVRESGAYRKARNDLPGLERETDEAWRHLEGLAARLGARAANDLIAAQPDDASRALAAELIEAGKKLRADSAACAAQLDRERADRAEKAVDRDRRGHVQDPRPAREKLASLAPLATLAQQTRQMADEIAADKAELARAGLRLSPPLADIGRLAAMSLPHPDRVAKAAKHFEELERRKAETTRDLQSVRADIAQLEAELRRLAELGDIATPDRIDAARKARDADWRALSATLLNAPGGLSTHEVPARVTAFERHAAEADRLADLATADARRVAAYAESGRRHFAELKRLQDLENREAGIAREFDEALSAWRAEWLPTGIAPLTPREMQTWRSQADLLIQQHEKIARRNAMLSANEEAIAQARPAFEKLAQDLRLDPLRELDIPAHARRIASELDRLDRAWEAGRELDTLIVALDGRIERAASAVQKAETALTAWTERFRAALPRIGLGDAADMIEAEAVLSVWKEAPGAVERHRSLERRVAGINRDSTAFQSALRDLAQATGHVLSDERPEDALSRIAEKMKEARTRETRRQELARQLEKAAQDGEDCLAKHEAALAGVRNLATKIAAPCDETPEPLARKLIARDELRRLAREKRLELNNAADGLDEHALREELASFDPDAADAELARLRDEEDQLVKSGQVAYAELTAAQDRLRILEGSVEAEVALQQRRNAEAEMLDAARRWAVLRIGALMIGTAIERQRASGQEPMMQRAGDLFAALTGGAFEGLGQSFDDQDRPFLVGRRPGAHEIEVGAMSEGARDQLYLSLRLAYLEDYASRSEPAPFIADDLFASFDDERTAHGLRALAMFGEKVQPIVFTHHRFVVDTAMRELGDGADIIEL